MVERAYLFARQLGIGQALATDAGHSSNEALGIGGALCWFPAAAVPIRVIRANPRLLFCLSCLITRHRVLRPIASQPISIKQPS